LVLEKSVLDLLQNSVIFEYDKKSDVFLVFEHDDYYGTTLTIDQMMKLSQEIAELAQKARQEEGQSDA